MRSFKYFLNRFLYLVIPTKQKNTLYAFYDLEVSPVSYDFLNFIVLAEQERTQKKLKYLHFVVVPGKTDGFRKDDQFYYDLETKWWRLKNIITSACWLIPSCHGVTICSSRQEAYALELSLSRMIFPQYYSVLHPNAHYRLARVFEESRKSFDLPGIQAPPGARNYVKDWIQIHGLEKKRIITINLREASYQEKRNSNLEEWGKFIKSVDLNVYAFVVLRDLEKAFVPLPNDFKNTYILEAALFNIEIRLALIEASFLNLGVNTGTMGLCWQSRSAAYLNFKMITEGYPTASTPEKFISIGLLPGSQFPFAKSFQRLIWEDDKVDVIQKEFQEFCSKNLHEANTTNYDEYGKK